VLLRPFSAEWAAAFRSAIEADATYRDVAASWTWPVAFVMHPAPEFGYPDSVAVELTLERGRCHDAVIRALDSLTAAIVLSAPYHVWKSVVRGELDPMFGVTGGKISVKGSLTTLMLNARAATALLVCARAVPTAFPDEA
jgi:putative sterol carrier protein